MNVVQEGVELDQTSHIQTQLKDSDGATNTDHSDTETVAFEVGVAVGRSCRQCVDKCLDGSQTRGVRTM